MIDAVFLKKVNLFITEQYFSSDEPYTPPYLEYATAIYHQFHRCIADSLFGALRESLRTPKGIPETLRSREKKDLQCWSARCLQHLQIRL